MKKQLLLTRMLLLVALLVGSVSAWGQSDYSATYTSNCTLTTGTNGSDCKVKVESGGTEYDGIKVGTSSKGGTMKVTVPAGTKYLHLHVSAWSGVNDLSLNITPNTYSSTTSIALTPNSGISSNSPFTFSGDATSSDYYKVVTFTNPLEEQTDFTFTTSSAKRFVIWGVNAEVAAIAITSIAFSEPKTASVGVGGTTALSLTVLPANHTEAVDWESDDEDVATVNSYGVVTGVSVGTAHITAKAHNNPSTIYDVCTVTVNTIPVASVSLDKTSANLVVGKTLTLEATVSPDNATNKNVTWESDNESVATVTVAGVVTAVAEGTAKITVKSEADPTKKAECTITVTDGSIDLRTTGEITFGNPFTSAEIGSGGYQTQECVLNCSDGNTYTWSEVDGYLHDGWQIKKTSGKVTSPTIKSACGFTISVTKSTNDVTISDGTNSGKNSLTTTKTNTSITIQGDGAYAVFTAIKITPLATITLNDACTDGENYYGTYSNEFAFVVPEGLTVSEIFVDENELLVDEYSTGDIVPAGTGVMVSSATSGDHTISLTSAAGTSIFGTDNCLKASGNTGIDAEAMAAAAPGCVYYRLTMHGGTELGFYYGADGGTAFDLAANKAYLAVPAASAKEGFSFISGKEETNGIKAVSTKVENGVRYNLAGQKVGADYKGIVIVNGKKYLSK